MNYLSIYNSIINKSKSGNRRRKSKKDITYVYYESHHIIPKCLGGTNDKSNLVLLTAREHFVVHQLLVKMYPSEHKLVFALRMMCLATDKHIRNNKEYSWIREKVAKSLSESQRGKSYGFKFPKGHQLSSGKNNGMFGKKHSNETKIKMSNIAGKRESEYYDFAREPKTQLHKENMQKSKQRRKYKLISPDGIETIFDRCADASNFSGVAVSALIKLAGKRYKFDNCKGWQCFVIPV